MPKHSLLPVESIQERDIDILLVEELTCNDEFANWIVSQYDFPVWKKTLNVYKSISVAGLGESDLFFLYQSEKHKVLLLIENKLDANFQPKQYKRYIQRSGEYIAAEICDECYCILVAPERFHSKEFMYKISYESIAQKLISIGDIRASFKAQLLHIASEKLRRRNTIQNSDIVLNFLNSYREIQQSVYSEILLPYRYIAGRRSDWVVFVDKSLPKIIIRHKLKDGFIDATFYNYPSSIIDLFVSGLPLNAYFETHNKTFSLRINVPKVYKENDFQAQIPAILKGIENIEILHKFMKAQIHKIKPFINL